MPGSSQRATTARGQTTRLRRPTTNERRDDQARGEHRCAGRHRRDVGLEGQVTHEVVAQREQSGPAEGEDDPDAPDVARPLGLQRQRDPAPDDEERSDEHGRSGPLSEGDHRDRHREERRHPERDRGPRRARLADRDGDEEVREPGRDRAREQERQQAVERDAALDGGRDAEHREGRASASAARRRRPGRAAGRARTAPRPASRRTAPPT